MKFKLPLLASASVLVSVIFGSGAANADLVPSPTSDDERCIEILTDASRPVDPNRAREIELCQMGDDQHPVPGSGNQPDAQSTISLSEDRDLDQTAYIWIDFFQSLAALPR